jgi:hypothetical protein
MSNRNFQYSFTSSKSPTEIFPFLLDPKNWWVGLFSEIIEGKSQAINDEFSFSAGDGLHYSRQKLTELVPGKRIAWLVTESNLSFLTNTNEWAGTKICFDLETENGKTKVIFTHEGLVPHFECYGGCSGAWTQYLERLERGEKREARS